MKNRARQLDCIVYRKRIGISRIVNAYHFAAMKDT